MLRKIFLLISALFVFSVFVTAQTPTPTPTPTKIKAPAFRPTKDQIKQGQAFLIKEKLYTGQATGVYGDSRPAIKAYQKANSLDQNGKFDRATLEKMSIALTDSQRGIAPTTKTTSTKTSKTTSATDGPKRPAPFQANKDQIMALQKILIDGKMFAGEANGARSDALKDSIKKYQTANSLKVTGGINAETLTKMGIALTDAQKANVAAQAAYDAANKH